MKQSATRKLVCGRFPIVRSLSTEESMNEILVAGESVATGAALRQGLPAFTDWRDRMFWNRIKVRKLR